MPRSPEEERRRAIKYGRRMRVLRASHSQKALEAEVKRMVSELRASRLPKEQVQRLVDNLHKYDDVRRYHGAVWAIVDALESLPDSTGK
ncbi:MAG: hypothetical protein U0441_19710 [Polyangiaceae bacterium]